METYIYLANSFARNHIQDLLADADASRRSRHARRSRLLPSSRGARAGRSRASAE